MEKKTLVLYPSPAIGHLIAMVELGQLILKHHPSFSITILISTQPYDAGSTHTYLDRVSRTTPSIHFHHLPTIISPNSSSSPHHETLIFELLGSNNPLVHQALQTISQTSSIKALIIDCFCTAVLEVSNELHIPTFFLFTSGAAVLAVFLHLKTILKNTTKSFKDMDATYLHIPGIPPLLATEMPKPMLDRQDKSYQGFLRFATHLHESKGFIVNTFESFEPRALKAIRDGLCLQDAETPPVYCIGPLIAYRDGGGVVHECLNWLESQPSRSVVFLSFGSMGLFSLAQLREIAIGLENSGQRFLWVVRSPPTEDKHTQHSAPKEPDLNSLLPEGFLERTKERGLVIKSWAPQVDVLSCESVGGFVTHCGWNSVLEAVCAGVPMLAWPLYGEQKMNRVFMVEELKIALRMEESKDGFVSASEVEKQVRQLMESEEGKAVREQTTRASQGAKVAMSEGGSSLVSLSVLADLLIQ